MFKILTTILVCIVCLTACSDTKETNMTASHNPSFSGEYPETRKDDVSDNYHGTEIADPFRWLEDDHSDETKDWVSRQNAVTDRYLESIPYRADLQKRIKELYNYERISAPKQEGDHTYFFRNDGLQNQAIYYRKSVDGGDEEIVLNPNEFSEGGTSSLGSTSFSEDGRYLAYQVSTGGSDWRTAYVLDTETMKLLPDSVEWIKFSGLSWAGNGFFYSRYPSPDESSSELSGVNEYHALYYHELGTDQSADKLIQDFPNHPKRNVYAQASHDGKYLVISPVEGTSGNALMIKNLTSDSKIQSVINSFDRDYNFLESIGNRLYFMTNKDAANKKIIALDEADLNNWIEIIPESTNSLEWATVVGNRIVCHYLQDAKSVLNVYDVEGKLERSIDLPGIGNVSSLSGKADKTDCYYTFTSFTTPTSIYKLDITTGISEKYFSPDVAMNPDDYETVQSFYTSKDGTKVPIYITSKKNLKKDGMRPTLLYGYGGFNISILPGFRPNIIALLDQGGIYAVANIRGGGEYGTEWHEAGTLDRKQNVFDDFIAGAEWLITNNYTDSDHLAIQGRSNGGLLAGACMTQRPDLFAVSFPQVGVLDMLRYHEFTIGWAWATDYGRSDDPDAFKYLIEYSPLHNVDNKSYPATLVTTADHDDRVVPAHSFKFIAELQDHQQGSNPTLIRIETSAGHGAGMSTEQRIQEETDVLSFMLYNMNQEVTL